MKRSILSLLCAAAATLVFVGAPAHAQADPVVEAARAAGQVGEQADGYLGLPPGSAASADVRARVEQINIRRRAAYTQRAAESGASANELAAAVACQIFASRIAVGERYRTESGQWRQRAPGETVQRPSFCPPG